MFTCDGKRLIYVKCTCERLPQARGESAALKCAPSRVWALKSGVLLERDLCALCNVRFMI